MSYLRLLFLSLFLALAGCGGGGISYPDSIGAAPPPPSGDDGSDDEEVEEEEPTAFNVITGTVSKGIVAGADVGAIDADGETLEVSATTGEDGSYSLELSAGLVDAGISLPLQIVVSGNDSTTMICDADLDTDGDNDCYAGMDAEGNATYAAFGETLNLGADFALRAAVTSLPAATDDGASATVNPTPMTELATALALGTGTTLTADQVESATAQVVNLLNTVTGVDFSGVDINELPSVNLADLEAAAAASEAALAAASFSAAPIAAVDADNPAADSIAEAVATSMQAVVAEVQATGNPGAFPAQLLSVWTAATARNIGAISVRAQTAGIEISFSNILGKVEQLAATLINAASGDSLSIGSDGISYEPAETEEEPEDTGGSGNDDIENPGEDSGVVAPCGDNANGTVSGTQLAANCAGTYTVTDTASGTHSRGTIIIDSDGNIDFDTGLVFSVSDNPAVFDRLFIEDEPRVQLNFGADDDGPAIMLYFSPTSGELIQIQYRNRNESIDVRANVTGGGSDDADSGSDDASGDSGADSGSGSGVDVDIPAGNYDLTITGQIITFGVGASFEARINGIPAPSPSDTTAVSQVIEETVAGLSNITNLSITIINNSSERVTFDVNFTAQQSGVEVTVELRYDYVPSA